MKRRALKTVIYLIGSLRNPEVSELGNQLRAIGYEVFDDWFAAGPMADDSWRDYEIARGHSFQQALKGYAAEHVFQFDKDHLDRAETGVLLLPSGKSGHLELGYLIGRGCRSYIIYPEEPKRFDVMYKFVDEVLGSTEEFLRMMSK